jgi:hypothetical protein
VTSAVFVLTWERGRPARTATGRMDARATRAVPGAVNEGKEGI